MTDYDYEHRFQRLAFDAVADRLGFKRRDDVSVRPDPDPGTAEFTPGQLDAAAIALRAIASALSASAGEAECDEVIVLPDNHAAIIVAVLRMGNDWPSETRGRNE